METGSAPEPPRASAIDTLKAPLPDSAQRQLEALRSAIDVRLAALEAVLADPARSESLETLILDLSRLATQEAQAAATRACVGMKLESDTVLAHARASAQAAVEQERSIAADLRRALEREQQRLVALQRENDAELKGVRDNFAAQIAQERAALAERERAVARLERTLDEANRQLEMERKATGARTDELARSHQMAADLRRGHAKVQAQLHAERTVNADLHAQLETGRTANLDLQTQLEAWRTTGAELRNGQADIEARLDAERAKVEQLEQQLSSVVTTNRQELAIREEIERQLFVARSEAQVLRADLDETRTRLDGLDAERASAERARIESEGRLEAAVRERDALATEVAVLRERLASTSSAPPALPDAEGEVGGVRLVTRYTFRQQIGIQVNRSGGLLCDLSVRGCQLLCHVPLKPNQSVKVQVPVEPEPLICAGKVVWARLEPAKAGQSAAYRAGVQFISPDESALETFMITYASTAE